MLAPFVQEHLNHVGMNGSPIGRGKTQWGQTVTASRLNIGSFLQK